MRKNKPFLIGIIIGIIVIGGIAIFPIIIELNKPKPIIPKPTYSNADITTIQYYNDLNSPATYTNPEYLRVGFHNSDGIYEEREHYRSLIQFDFSDIKYEWKSCIFSVYQSSINDDYNRGRYNLYFAINSTWNEQTTYLDWTNEGISVGWAYIPDVIHIEYNISKYIKNAFSITIRIAFQNAHLTDDDNYRDAYFEMYSRHSDIDNKYKPQLIWS